MKIRYLSVTHALHTRYNVLMTRAGRVTRVTRVTAIKYDNILIHCVTRVTRVTREKCLCFSKY